MDQRIDHLEAEKQLETRRQSLMAALERREPALRSPLLHELGTVLEGLRRIRSGKYGLCEDCEEPISSARLKQIPGASRCRTCEGEHEYGRSRGPATRPS